METRYYYLRLPDDKPASWIPCSKARAERRLKAAIETEEFYNYVVSIKVTKAAIQIKDLLWDIREGTGVGILTVNRHYVESDTVENTVAFALEAFHEAACRITEIATRQ